jgi:hypothetical protein
MAKQNDMPSFQMMISLAYCYRRWVMVELGLKLDDHGLVANGKEEPAMTESTSPKLKILPGISKRKHICNTIA